LNTLAVGDYKLTNYRIVNDTDQKSKYKGPVVQNVW
jgi:hypothetical protein